MISVRFQANFFTWSVQQFRQNAENYFFFLPSENFPIKFDNVKLLGLECSINPQHLMKIVKANFYKLQILNFFLNKLSLILRVGRKRKAAQKYSQQNSQIADLNELGQLDQALCWATATTRIKKNQFQRFSGGKNRQCHVVGF